MKPYLSILIALLVIATPALAYKYCVYGDSIAGGYGVCDNCSYSEWIEPGTSTWHNTDGAGQWSSWGLANIGTHYSASCQNFLIAFGTNDIAGGRHGADIVHDLEAMYNYSSANGSRTAILIPPLRGNKNNTFMIGNLQNNFTRDSIPYLNVFDALDTNPDNGIPDGWQLAYYIDNVHPNAQGHAMIGRYIWDNWMKGMTETTGSRRWKK